MSHSFSVSITQSPATVVEKVRKLLSENGSHFNGNASSGNFSGSGVEGSYHISGQTVNITITKKPFMAPMALVESKVKDFFKSA